MSVAWGRAAARCAAVMVLSFVSGVALAQPNCTQFNGTSDPVPPGGLQKDRIVVLVSGDRVRLMLTGAIGEMFVNNNPSGTSFTATTNGNHTVGVVADPTNPPTPGTATFECTPAPVAPPNPNPPNPNPNPPNADDIRRQNWNAVIGHREQQGMWTVVDDQSDAVFRNAETEMIKPAARDPERLLDGLIGAVQISFGIAFQPTIKVTDLSVEERRAVLEAARRRLAAEKARRKSLEADELAAAKEISALEHSISQAKSFMSVALLALSDLERELGRAQEDAQKAKKAGEESGRLQLQLAKLISQLENSLVGAPSASQFAPEERRPGRTGRSPFGAANEQTGSPWSDPVFGSALGYAGLPVKAPAASGPVAFRSRAIEGWSVWGSGRYTSFRQSGLAATDGHFATFVGGVNYRPFDRWLVGLAVGYEDQKFDTSFNGGYFRGHGPTVGPYVSYLLSPNLIATAWMGAAFLSYSTSDGTGFGNFDARRYFVSGSLIGTWNYGAWRFSPRVSAFYATEKRDGFTDNLGLVMPGGTVSGGRVQIGPELGYRFVAFDGRGYVEPYGFLALDCHFGSNMGVLVAAGIVVTDTACGGRAGGGVKFAGRNGISGTLSAAYNSIGRTGQNSWTLGGVVTVPLTFGLR